MQEAQEHCVTFNMGKLSACVLNFVLEIDEGQGLGLCTQRLNNRIPHTHTHKIVIYYTTISLTFL